MKFNKIATFEEWVESIRAEYAKLGEVSYYLNEKGQERLSTFSTLLCLAAYCSDASELVEWIDSKENLNKHEIAALERAPTGRLRQIAANERGGK